MRQVFGLSLVALGAFLFLLPQLRGGEKPQAVFILGHWWDVFRELELPCLAVGAFLLLSTSQRLRGKPRRDIR